MQNLCGSKAGRRLVARTLGWAFLFVAFCPGARAQNSISNWLGAGRFQFTADAYTVSEQESAAVADSLPGARITVTRVGGGFGFVDVDYAVTEGTALPDQHYGGGTFQPVGTLRFADFQMSADLIIPIIDNTESNENRTFTITLASPRSAFPELAGIVAPELGAVTTATINILDDEYGFNLQRAVYRVNESRLDSRTSAPADNSITITVSVGAMTEPREGAVSVGYRVLRSNQFPLQAGSDYAAPGVDFEAASGTLTFGRNDTQREFTIRISDDNLVEFNEDFRIELNNPTGRFGSGTNAVDAALGQVTTATGTILFDGLHGAIVGTSGLTNYISESPAGAVDWSWNPDNVPYSVPANNPRPGANGQVFAVLGLPNGSTLLAGDFTSVNAARLNGVARLDTNGWVDATFNIGDGARGSVQALAVYTSGPHAGKILIGGGFDSFDGKARGGVARLQANGALDESFNPGEGVDGMVTALAIQPDGKAIIVGAFTAFNRVPRLGVARLDANGSLDSSFDPGAGADGTVWAVALSGGAGGAPLKVLLAGDFFSFDNQDSLGLARLNTDGSRDATFNFGGGADGPIYALALQPDGRIVVGGGFTLIDLKPRSGVARLLPDGALDDTFNVGNGASDTVYALHLQPDGRVLLGGAFEEINNVRRMGVARLLTNGLLDTSFLDYAYNQHAGLLLYNDFVRCIGLQPGGQVLVGGKFDLWGGGFTRDFSLRRWNIARLVGGETPGPGNLEFSVPQYRVDEGAVMFYATLMRTNGMLGAVSVSGATKDIVAKAGQDYQSASGSAAWPSLLSSGANPGEPGWMVSDGATNRLVPSPLIPTLAVPITDDNLIEGDETFQFDLLPSFQWMLLGGEAIPIGVALGRSSATVAIADDDIKPGTIAFSSARFVVNEDGTNAVITVIRTNGAVGTVTINYTLGAASNNTAQAGSDYIQRPGNTLTFASGVTNQTLLVRINDDTDVEADESFIVRLFNPTGGATLSSSNLASVIIIDNDYAPGRLTFSQPQFVVNEYGGSARMVVWRTGGSVSNVSVRYATTNGSALAGQDFSDTSGILTWADGDTSDKVFFVPILNDDLVEGAETNFLVLSDFVGALPGFQTNASLRIVDDDAFGSLEFSSASYFTDENGGAAVITVVRRGGMAGAVSVRYFTTNQPSTTATTNIDYQPVSGLLNFASGQLSATFEVPVLDDSASEGNETVRLRLTQAANGATLGTLTNVLLTIVDNESVNIPAGSLDTSFNPFAGANGYVNALAIQTNGAVLLGGEFTQVNTVTRSHVARLLSNGNLDATFDPGAGPDGAVRALLLLSDGRIVLGGSFTAYNGVNRNNLTRINTDGSLDVSFNPGPGADGLVHALASTTVNGLPKLLVGGGFTSVAGARRNSIARLNTEGTVDTTFDPGTGANGPVYAVAVQADGRMIVGGDFSMFNNTPLGNLVRLHPDGTVDPTFSPGTGADSPVRALAIQVDGRVLVGGSFTNFNGMPVGRLVRLNADGSLDVSFLQGAGASGSVLALALQLDGKILVGGDFLTFHGVTRNRLTRLNADGSTDTTINFGTGANSFVAALAVQPDRKIVLGGGFTLFNDEVRQYIARIHGGALAGSGTLDFMASQFTVDEAAGEVRITVRRLGGTTGAVGVSYLTTNGTATSGLDYTMATGALEFSPGETRRTFAVPVLNDLEVEGAETVNLLLLNPTGGARLGPQPTATLEILSDDSVVAFSLPAYGVAENIGAGGALINVLRSGATGTTVTVEYRSRSGTATPPADYLPANGTLTFGPGETNKFFNVPIVNDSLVEANETILLELRNLVGQAVLGSHSNAVLTIFEDDFAPGMVHFSSPTYSALENAAAVTLTVLRTNGSSGVLFVRFFTQDLTAKAGEDYYATNGILTFADGEISQSLTFRFIDDERAEDNEDFQVVLADVPGSTAVGSPSQAIVTIENDQIRLGSVDRSFDPGEGGNSFVRSVAVQSDGKLVLGGGFTQWDGRPRHHVARLHPDGAHDLTFNPGAGADALVTSVAVADDGRIVAGGSFSNFNARAYDRLVRLQSNGGLDASFEMQVDFDAAINVVALEDSGRIVAGGNFNLPTRAVARVRTSGTLDVSFAPGSGANGPVHVVLVLPDGRLVVGGSFTEVGGSPRGRVALLTAAGLVDETFAPANIPSGSVYALAVQPDGRLVIGGDFPRVGGLNMRGIARLLPNGSLDPEFDAGSGVNGTVYCLGVQSNGRIVLGGDFTSVHGVPRGRFARLLADGAVDADFDSGIGADGLVYALAVLPDSGLIIAGGFTKVSGVVRKGVARIHALDPVPEFLNIERVGDVIRTTLRSVAGQRYALEASQELVNWAPLTTNQAVGATVVLEDVTALPDGMTRRFYRARVVSP